jgi:hypothetical protein
MMKALRITHWEDAHETYESQKLKFLNWVAVPNKHDGLGFGHLRAQPDDVKVPLYCAFALMVQIASKAPKGMRGWLIRNGKRLEPHDLAVMTGFPQAIFAQAFDFFQRPEMGWLSEQDLPAQTPELTARLAANPARPAGVPARPAGDTADHAGISPTDRQGGSTEHGRERSPARSAVSEPPSLEAVIKAAGSLHVEQKPVPADYAEHFWRKKNEKPGSWFEGKTGVLINWRQQLENWWLEDRAEWSLKNGAPLGEDLEAQLAKETDPAKRRQLKEEIERANA